MIVVAVIGLVIVACIELYTLWYKRSYKWAASIPTTGDELPIIGVAHLFNGRSREERYNILMKYAEEYPKWGTAWFGPFRCALYIHDPPMLQKIYNASECLDKPDFYKFFGLGNGLVTVNAHNWRSRRRMMNFAFTLKVLQSFIPIFEDCSVKICKTLAQHVDGGKIDFLEFARQASFDMILATSFGDKDNRKEETQIIKKCLLENLEIVSLRMFNLKYYSDLVFRFTKYYQQDKITRTECINFADRIIEKRLKSSEAKKDLNANERQEDEESSKKPKILVDMILKMKADDETLTREEIQHHMFTMFSAGNETIAALVSDAILFMAMEPDVQEKVVAELRDVFFAPHIEIDYDQLKKLTYMEMVMKETMRIAPPVPLMARRTIADFQLTDEVRVPKGTEIIVNISALHRRRAEWGENPQVFNPDNFLLENAEKRHPYSYMPFSLGPRICIGDKYSMISAKILLVHLLKNFKFNTELKWTDIKFMLDVHLFMTSPKWVTVEKRHDFYRI